MALKKAVETSPPDAAVIILRHAMRSGDFGTYERVVDCFGGHVPNFRLFMEEVGGHGTAKMLTRLVAPMTRRRNRYDRRFAQRAANAAVRHANHAVLDVLRVIYPDHLRSERCLSEVIAHGEEVATCEYICKWMKAEGKRPRDEQMLKAEHTLRLHMLRKMIEVFTTPPSELVVKRYPSGQRLRPAPGP